VPSLFPAEIDGEFRVLGAGTRDLPDSTHDKTRSKLAGSSSGWDMGQVGRSRRVHLASFPLMKRNSMSANLKKMEIVIN